MASLPHITNAVNSTGKAINVAIIGGGIGGISLALGLLKLPHVDVQVYESAHTFSEIGAGVSIGANAARALALIGPAAKQAVEKSASGNLWASHSDTFSDYLVVSHTWIIIETSFAYFGHKRASEKRKAPLFAPKMLPTACRAYTVPTSSTNW